MYKIIKKLDGKFYCECTIQDGTERWIEDTLGNAIASMKQSAECLNHDKIKRKDIEVYFETSPGNFVFQKSRAV